MWHGFLKMEWPGILRLKQGKNETLTFERGGVVLKAFGSPAGLYWDSINGTRKRGAWPVEATLWFVAPRKFDRFSALFYRRHRESVIGSKVEAD